ncbi:MAG TPA: acireductone synthase [Candidatus Polarisedimenticolia bacterium]|nr:acireductone synthase [Candidatus Polarisedimenticolia bacterium]
MTTNDGDAETPCRLVLLDIEGTTTPVSFVTKTLFPYARKRLGEFLADPKRAALVARELEELKLSHAADTGFGAPSPGAAYIEWLMDRDAKTTALKSLQGKIWREGYERGELHGEVYPDVPPAFERWMAHGVEIAIFSSGSVEAQRLLFAHAGGVDLSHHIRGFFDTATGGKKEPASYRAIAAATNVPPRQVMFVSDTVEELDAARQAGMTTALCVRPGAAEPDAPGHPIVRSFAEVMP